MRTLDTLSAAFVSALAFATPSPSAAAPPEPATEDASAEPLSVHFEIVADTLSGAQRPEVEAEVERQFLEVAAANGLASSDSLVADLVIRIEFTQPDPKADMFVVHGLSVYEGKVLQRDETRTCMRCTSAELAANGLKSLMPAVEVVRSRRAEAAAQRAAEAAAAAEPPPVVDVAPPPRVHPIGPLGYVGIASTAIGLGTSVAGVVYLYRGQEGTDSMYITDYRPAGRTLLGLGLGAMVAGIVLEGVDLGVLAPRRRARARAKLDGLAFAPASGGTSVLISGRF